MSAEQQLEAANGLDNPTLFSTVKVTIDEEGNPLVDAWQVKRAHLRWRTYSTLSLSHAILNIRVTSCFEMTISMTSSPFSSDEQTKQSLKHLSFL
jgi:hypothetical protein